MRRAGSAAPPVRSWRPPRPEAATANRKPAGGAAPGWGRPGSAARGWEAASGRLRAAWKRPEGGRVPARRPAPGAVDLPHGARRCEGVG